MNINSALTAFKDRDDRLSLINPPQARVSHWHSVNGKESTIEPAAALDHSFFHVNIAHARRCDAPNWKKTLVHFACSIERNYNKVSPNAWPTSIWPAIAFKSIRTDHHSHYDAHCAEESQLTLQRNLFISLLLFSAHFARATRQLFTKLCYRLVWDYTTLWFTSDPCLLNLKVHRAHLDL